MRPLRSYPALALAFACAAPPASVSRHTLPELAPGDADPALGFEPLPERRAADVLPPELRAGPHHRVDDRWARTASCISIASRATSVTSRSQATSCCAGADRKRLTRSATRPRGASGRSRRSCSPACRGGALVEARAGETLAALGARSGNAWSPAETAAWNGRTPGAPLAGGELLKIARTVPWSGPGK